MDITELKKLLDNSEAGGFFRPVCLDSVDSTNEYIKREAAAGAGEGLLATAEEQTAGKGRSGRSWVSPKEEALYFSFLLKPQLPPENVSALTLVMGLSVAQAVREYPGLETGIKWPNDVVIGGRKICGILTEGSAHEGNIDYIVIGTGINVNNSKFPKELRDKAVSLKMESGGMPASRECVLALVLDKFCKNYRIYLQTGNLEGLLPDYNELLVSKGKEVRIEDPAGAYTAVSGGIDESGRLIVTRDDGTSERISAGEVSVRGIYGYI